MVRGVGEGTLWNLLGRGELEEPGEVKEQRQDSTGQTDGWTW